LPKKFILARFSNFYGPYQPNYRLIPKIILSILDNKIFKIHGDGLSKRNYIYVDDFCEGILKVIRTKKVKNIYHFSGNNFYSVKDVVNKVCRIMKVNFYTLVKFTKDRKGKDKIYKLNSTETRNSLAWKTKFDIDLGIKNTINFIQKNRKLINIRPKKFKISN